jgi:hypothetical protein
VSDWSAPSDPLLDLTDRARLADAAASRVAQRDLTARATELATLAGTLHDLAEHRAGVVVTTTSGRTQHGSLAAVAVDHVGMITRAGQQVFLRTDAIAILRPDPSHRSALPQGERGPAQDMLLLERCERWLQAPPMLAIGPRGAAELVRGRLLSVAEDLLTIALEGTHTTAHVAAHAIEMVVLDTPAVP